MPAIVSTASIFAASEAHANAATMATTTERHDGGDDHRITSLQQRRGDVVGSGG